jgi:hypothetical protein
LLVAGDLTELVPLNTARRGAAPAAPVEEPSTIVVALRERAVADPTELLPVGAGQARAGEEKTLAMVAGGTILLPVPEEQPDDAGTLLLAAPVPQVAARPDEPTSMLPGERGPVQSGRPAPRSSNGLVILNIVLIALAAAGLAWVTLG